MSEIEKMFNELFNKNLEIKKKYDDDAEWRKDLVDKYIVSGMSKDVAIEKAWEEYWKMAEERDGVKFSINRLD